MRKHALVSLLLGALALVTLSCAATATSTPTPAASPATLTLPGLLVETDWLAQHLSEEELRVVDVRAASKYQEGHIPGAINLPLSEVTVAEPVEGMVAPSEQVEAVLGSRGIGSDGPVVIYDDSRSLSASRLYWVLEYYGHRQAAILNGGYPKWVAENRELTRVSPKVVAARFVAYPDPSRSATKEYVLANLNKPGIVILDVRSPKEYSGEDVRAARGGHIPGAVNIDWVNNVTGDIPVFKALDELRSLYTLAGVTPDKEVIIHCQTAVRSAHTYLVLRLLGYENVRNYDGSWVEWGNDPSTPIEG